METLLLNSSATQVIAALQALQQRKEMPSAVKLITCYRENNSRMYFACYLRIGKGLIGSGGYKISLPHGGTMQAKTFGAAVEQSGGRF